MAGPFDTTYPAPQPGESGTTRRIRALVESKPFRSFILTIIVLAGLLVGLETYPAVMERVGPTLKMLDRIVITIFVIEITLRLMAYGSRFWRFFADPWNVFDFVIVVACLLPVGTHYAAVARLVRVLRVFRLFSGIPRLRLVVTAMMKAIPSIGYVGILLILLFYVYGVMGTTLFGRNDPAHFGDLHTAMLSLLRTVTLEDWTDLMYAQIYGTDTYAYDSSTAAKLSAKQRAMWEPQAMPVLGVLYFASFVLVGTMIVLNLFIGVVISSLTDAQAEQAREAVRRQRQH
ncbi:MAG: ion transporter, partial [Planctomycetota bacterium]